MTSNIYRVRTAGVQNQNYSHFMTVDRAKYRRNLYIDLNARKILEKLFRSYYVCNIYTKIITKIIDQKSRIYFSSTVVVLNLIPAVTIKLAERFIRALDPLVYLELKIEKYYNQPITAGIVAAKMCAQLSEPGSIQRKLNYILKLTMRKGAIGCIIKVKGRIGGAEIARHESIKGGRIRRNTIIYDVTRAVGICYTRSGTIGVDVSLHRPQYSSDNKTDKIV